MIVLAMVSAAVDRSSGGVSNAARIAVTSTMRTLRSSRTMTALSFVANASSPIFSGGGTRSGSSSTASVNELVAER